jgi:hypothetical protein
MAEMAEFLGGVHTSEASKWNALHAKSVDSFNNEFWNETAGLYSDWIDIRGKRRNCAQSCLSLASAPIRRSVVLTIVVQVHGQQLSAWCGAVRCGVVHARTISDFYVWQQFNAIDLTSGIANRSRAVRMLSAIDGYYAAMRKRYNKTLDDLWCTPTNLDAERGKNWSGVQPYDTYQEGMLQDQRWFGCVQCCL